MLLCSQRVGPVLLITLTVSYADMIVVGALKCMLLLDNAEMTERLKNIEPAFLTLYNASQPWLERDDH